MARWRRRLAIVGVFVTSLGLLSFIAPPLHAAPYGVGPYSSCAVQEDCPDNTPSSGSSGSAPGGGTVATTPGGLDVVINLNNGQVIPRAGYTVVVSPLTADGRGIERVEFYVGDQLAATVVPDEDGNVRWNWDPTKFNGTHLKIVIYATDGTTVTKEFDVALEAAEKEPATLPATSKSGGIFDGFINFAAGIGRSLPGPLVFSLPYVLLFVLLIIVLLLFWQSRREAREIRLLEQSLQRERMLAEEKRGFIQLASHYLRTPVTIIKGGIDMLRGEATGAADKLAADADRLHNNIEGLLQQSAEAIGARTLSGESQASERSVWLRPAFWLPIVLIGLLLLFSNFIIANTASLSVSQVGILTQGALFVALAVGLYVVLRSSVLVKRARARTAIEHQQQLSVNETRNSFIAGSANALDQSLSSIRANLQQLPSGKAVGFITDGCDRASQLLDRFRAASTIAPIDPASPFTSVALSQLLQASNDSIAAAQQKGIGIITSGDAQITSQQPEWVGRVLRSLVENAVSYSPPKGQVEIAVRHGRGSTSIAVRDQGQGIPQDKLDELFQPFSRTDNKMAVEHPGMGFSLYLDRLLMTNLGGKITIDSRPGKGTLATMTFPSA